MAFCTSCGREITPGTRFCESCGAPVEQQQAPPGPEPQVPQRPPLVPPPPPKRPVPAGIIIGIVLAIAIIAAAAWFVGLPYLQKMQAGSAATPPASPAVTPPAVPHTLPPVVQTATPVPTTVRKLEGRYEEYYDEIYTKNQFFAYGQAETFTHDLATPPLYIKYNLTPKLLTRSKVINIGLSTEQTINITYPNPNAWFEVKVLYADSGGVVEKRGYGKDYPDVTRSEFMVRSPGNYRIEFSGNDVDAEISVLQGKT
jgi:hypothetical protein